MVFGKTLKNSVKLCIFAFFRVAFTLRSLSPNPRTYPAPIRKVEFRGANWTANRTNRSVNHESYRAADPLRGTIRGVRFAVHANIMGLWVSLRFVLRYSSSNSIWISMETLIEICQPDQPETTDSGSQNHQPPLSA